MLCVLKSCFKQIDHGQRSKTADVIDQSAKVVSVKFVDEHEFAKHRSDRRSTKRLGPHVHRSCPNDAAVRFCQPIVRADLQVQNQGNRFFGPLSLSRKSAQAMDEIHEDPRFCSLRQDRQNLNLSSLSHPDM